MNHKEVLLHKIETRRAIVGILGLGYVGLPLAVQFAEAGFSVLALDVDPDKVDQINQGHSYIEDIPSERLQPLVQDGLLRAVTHYAELRTADAISICVPTPLRKTRDPDMSYIIQAVDALQAVAHEGMLVTLESTTYPGTTQEIVRPRLEQDGRVVGESLFIAFSPERIDPGNQTYDVHNTPKVVGGMTPHCSQVASALYQTGVSKVVEVSSPTVAEMVKLLENTFRAVNIGLVNEMALMCDKLGIDVWEVVDAAATKPFGYMPFYPGPGLGGHCIPIDPHYLSWKLKTLNYNARFIELASEINTSMPYYVLDKINDGLNDIGKPINGSRVVVLGVAYKPNVDDVRESPALDVIDLLRQKGADVTYHDPLVPKIKLHDGIVMENIPYTESLLSQADCVVIITNHKTIDWDDVRQHSPMIVDTRNVYNAAQRNGPTPIITL